MEDPSDKFLDSLPEKNTNGESEKFFDIEKNPEGSKHILIFCDTRKNWNLPPKIDTIYPPLLD